MHSHDSDPGSSSQTQAGADPTSPPATARIAAPEELKVLLADDDADILWSVAKTVEYCGCEVLRVASGHSALESVRAAMPDVAILDIGMPDLDGHEVARRIRQMPQGADILLIAATGWGHETARRHAHEAGFDAHLVKPIALNDVRVLLDDFRRRRLTMAPGRADRPKDASPEA